MNGFRARKVFGTFEKRAPGNDTSQILISVDKIFSLFEVINKRLVWQQNMWKILFQKKYSSEWQIIFCD